MTNDFFIFVLDEDGIFKGKPPALDAPPAQIHSTWHKVWRHFFHAKQGSLSSNWGAVASHFGNWSKKHYGASWKDMTTTRQAHHLYEASPMKTQAGWMSKKWRKKG